MLTFIFLAGRIISSPLVNIFQKRLTNKNIYPLWIVFLTYTLLSIFSLPLLFFVFKVPVNATGQFWFYALSMGAIDAVGNLFLVKSVQKMDISLFGPLNSFKPAIALVLGIFIIQELPSLTGLLGIFIIIIGSLILNPPKRKFRLNEGVVYRFLAMFFASLAAVISKKVILMSSPLITLLFWMWVGVPVLFIFCQYLSLFQWKTVVTHFGDYLGIVVSIACMQFFTLVVFEQIQVSYGLALFQLSTVVSVILGRLIFKEKDFSRRLAAALVMICGALLIIFTR